MSSSFDIHIILTSSNPGGVTVSAGPPLKLLLVDPLLVDSYWYTLLEDLSPASLVVPPSCIQLAPAPFIMLIHNCV